MEEREVVYDVSKMSWSHSTQLAGDSEEKILRSGRTLLVRLAPGGELRPHCHQAPVQHYVLEGAYETQGRTVTAGTYRLIPGGSDVALIHSKGGAVILMIMDPIGD